MTDPLARARALALKRIYLISRSGRRGANQVPANDDAVQAELEHTFELSAYDAASVVRGAVAHTHEYGERYDLDDEGGLHEPATPTPRTAVRKADRPERKLARRLL